MRYHYKKKRYKIKPFTYIVVLLLLIGIIYSIVRFAGIKSDKEKAPSSTATESLNNVSSDNFEKISSEAASEMSSSDDKVSSDVKNESEQSNSNVPTAAKPKGSITDWNLILLNRDNSISKELQINKTKFDTQYIDSRIASAYEKMKLGAKEAGIDLYLRSGYRSIATQQNNYNNAKQSYINQGKTEVEAIKLVEQYYAIPGQSEHHTGLALDIITPQYHNEIHELSEKFAETDAFKWLSKNCYDYGFILRYPKDKVEITKINYEPWHYRYVGIEHAKYMKDNNLCLEEYIALF